MSSLAWSPRHGSTMQNTWNVIAISSANGRFELAFGGKAIWLWVLL